MALAALAVITTAASPARAAQTLEDPSPLKLVGIEPAGPGEVNVRMRVSASGISAAVTVQAQAETASLAPVDGYGRRTARVARTTVEGPGRLVVIPSVGSPTAAVNSGPFCDRGGYPIQTLTREFGGGTVLHVPGDADVDLLFRVAIPAGFPGIAPRLQVTTSELVPDTGDEVLPLASLPARIIPLPAAAVPERQVTLSPVRFTARGSARVKGQVMPARAGVAVAFVGRRINDPLRSVLWKSSAASAPIGAGLRSYGTAVTDASGRFTATVPTKPGSVVVARTALEPGVALAGASCPLWVPKAKAKAKKRR